MKGNNIQDKIEKLFSCLKEMNLPIKYRGSFEKVSLPFIIYYQNEQATFYADNKVYYTSPEFVILLCTKNKDYIKEEQLENIFEKYNINYIKEETYLDEEQIFQIEYYINLGGI